MATWFTSDTHLGHTNIIDFCHRPFWKSLETCQLCAGTGRRTVGRMGEQDCLPPDVHAHDEALIAKWNNVVAPDDVVYHLGDFAFGNFKKITEYAERLNGQKTLIRGNHDRLSDSQYRRMGFRVRKYMVLGSVHLQHHPPRENEASRGFYLVGHVHQAWTDRRGPRTLILNVGVDVRGYRPVTADELGLDPNLLF